VAGDEWIERPDREQVIAVAGELDAGAAVDPAAVDEQRLVAVIEVVPSSPDARFLRAERECLLLLSFLAVVATTSAARPAGLRLSMRSGRPRPRMGSGETRPASSVVVSRRRRALPPKE
jgi:hypothetical protein